VLLALCAAVRAGEVALSGGIFASDANAPLIHFYRNVQSSPEELCAAARGLTDAFLACPVNGPVNRAPADEVVAVQSRESFYYWTRAQYNAMGVAGRESPLGSARLLFLNKTCFRGLFREGPRGFNVPYGHYANPEVFSEAALHEISELLQNVTFTPQSFEDSLADVAEGDFVYLDPPYAPETAASFVGYTAAGFGAEKHATLFDAVRSLGARGARWLMSNADVQLVRDAFAENATMRSILCKRSINSKRPSATARELLIKNF
jgi:DNA adenine methylase